MSNQIIDIPRKKEFFILSSLGWVGMVVYLIFLDVRWLHGPQYIHLTSMIPLIVMQAFVIGAPGLSVFLMIPDFLLIYTEEGIRWPSIRGYKLMRWSEINAATFNITFWRGSRIILASPDKRIVINAQLFANPDDGIAAIRKHVSEEKWR